MILKENQQKNLIDAVCASIHYWNENFDRIMETNYEGDKNFFLELPTATKTTIISPIFTSKIFREMKRVEPSFLSSDIAGSDFSLDNNLYENKITFSKNGKPTVNKCEKTPLWHIVSMNMDANGIIFEVFSMIANFNNNIKSGVDKTVSDNANFASINFYSENISNFYPLIGEIETKNKYIKMIKKRLTN